MGEDESSSPNLPRPVRGVPADRVLLECAETLDLAAVQQRYPDWDRGRLCALLGAAAKGVGRADRPLLRQRLGALFAMCVVPFALFATFSVASYIDQILKEMSIRAGPITRLALSVSTRDPILMLLGTMALGLVLVIVCFIWAWWSRKRLRWFTSGIYIAGTVLALAFLLVCVFPLLSAWSRGFM